MGNCIHCGEQAGFLRRKHKRCENIHRQGLAEMTEMAQEAASATEFSAAAVRQRLAEVAARAFAGEDHVTAAIERGWERAVAESLADGVLTQSEETGLRGFRDKLALAADAAEGAAGQLDRAAQNRIQRDARAAALAAGNGADDLGELSRAIDQLAHQRRIK